MEYALITLSYCAYMMQVYVLDYHGLFQHSGAGYVYWIWSPLCLQIA